MDMATSGTPPPLPSLPSLPAQKDRRLQVHNLTTPLPPPTMGSCHNTRQESCLSPWRTYLRLTPTPTVGFLPHDWSRHRSARTRVPAAPVVPLGGKRKAIATRILQVCTFTKSLVRDGRCR
ncbi:hypothetical protein LZ31DRAFT_78505 [Colletotrichum somersetense]|nr:hypothetical protein LZ31DRAFT_78505 [Colletotrichum somersetense]